jgi:hypothetical protein
LYNDECGLGWLNDDGTVKHFHYGERGLVAQMERNQRRRDTAKGKGPASRVARMAIAQREGRRPRPL